MAKSAIFGLLHMGIAFGVTFALTGNAMAASAVMLVEPAVNTLAHYFYDRWWDARRTGPGGLGSPGARAEAQAS